MLQVTLNVSSPEGEQQVALTGERLTVGRGGDSMLVIPDAGLSRLHATIHSDGGRVWVVDENSTNGTRVNGEPVPPVGTPLEEGDRVEIGNATVISISFPAAASGETPAAVPAELAPPAGATAGATEAASAVAPTPSGSPSMVPILFALVGVVILLIAGVVIIPRALRGGSGKAERADSRDPSDVSTPAPANPGGGGPPDAPPTPAPTSATGANSNPTNASNPSDDFSVPGGGAGTTDINTLARQKRYLDMTPDEQVEFVEDRARHISLMMGNRPYSFNEDVLRIIKGYVDGYARRVGNNSTRMWGEDLRFMFGRARGEYSPHITRAFRARGVPPVVGLYLVVVETEYHNISSENFAGAAGLFQFIGPTARGYGVDPSERTNVAKMAPAAAHYLADRIAEFGPDSMSVMLAIAGYNRSPDSVRRDLHDVINSENRERSFWTLVANAHKLDHYFQNENIKYVPKFFAAAIVGENPWAFGLEMQPLSTYDEVKNTPEAGVAVGGRPAAQSP